MNSNGEKEPSKLLASSKSLLINLSSFKRGNRNLSKSIADLPSTLCSVTLTHFQSPTSGNPAVVPTPTLYPLPEPSRIPAQQAAYRQVPASAIRPTRIPATLPPPVRPTLTPHVQHPPPAQRTLPPTRTLPSRAPLNPPPAPARSAQTPNPLSPLGQKRKTLSEGGTRQLPPSANDLKRRRLDNEGFHQSSSTHSIPLRAELSSSPDESSSIPRKVSATQIPPPRRPMYRATHPPPQLSTPDPPTTLPTPQPTPFRLSSPRPPPPTATIRPTHPPQRASVHNNNPARVPPSQPVKQPPQATNTPQYQLQHPVRQPQQSVRLLQVNNARRPQPPPQQLVRPPQVNTVQPQPQTQSIPTTLQPKKNLTMPSGFGKRAHSLSIASVTQNGLPSHPSPSYSSRRHNTVV